MSFFTSFPRTFYPQEVFTGDLPTSTEYKQKLEEYNKVFKVEKIYDVLTFPSPSSSTWSRKLLFADNKKQYTVFCNDLEKSILNNMSKGRTFFHYDPVFYDMRLCPIFEKLENKGYKFETAVKEGGLAININI